MNDICGYCDKDGKQVELSFEEARDKKKRRYLKAVCPECGRTTKKWPKRSEDTPIPDTSKDIPEDIPEISEEDSEGEQVVEVIEGIVTDPEIQEKIQELNDIEEEEEEEPDKKIDIAILICTAIIIVQLIIIIWLGSKVWGKKEGEHGKKD